MEWYIFALVSAVFLAGAVILMKKVMEKEHALEFAGFRSFINIILLAILAFTIDFDVMKRELLLMMVAGVFIAIGFYYRNKSIRHGKLSEVIPFTNLGVFVVLLFGIIFLDEVPTGQQVLGILISFIGVYLLESGKTLMDSFKNIYKDRSIHESLVAVLMYSISVVIIREILTTVNPFTALFYVWLTTSIILIFFDLERYGLKNLTDFKRDFGYIAIISILFFLSNIAFFIAISLPAGKASITHSLRLSGNVFVTFFASTVYHEGHILKKTFASFIILIGAILIIL